MKIEQGQNIDSLHGVEFYSGIIIPGFVNAHCHLELSYLRGNLKGGEGLTGFVSEIAAKRNLTCSMDRVLTADYHDAKMWSEGVMAVGDICNDSSTFGIKAKSKITYLNFIELFGLDAAPQSVSKSWESACDLTYSAEEFSLTHSITPHATYSVSDPLWTKICANAAAEQPLRPLSIHFMESRAEAELFRAEGALSDRYRALGVTVDFDRFQSPADRLVSTIESHVPLLLIHNTFVTQEDIDLIQGHFTNVTWVVCPRSNAYIERAVPPYELLLRNGCRIALGTDSLASNSTLSPLDELRFMATQASSLSLQQMVEWATLNGAEALGLADIFGSFDIGKAPGALLIENPDWSSLKISEKTTIRRLI